MVTIDRHFCCQVLYSLCSIVVLTLAIVVAFICLEINNEHLGWPIEVDGAQLLGMDWMKQPFVEMKKVAGSEDCPVDFPEEMVYDIWQGLQDVCFCHEESEIGSAYRDGGCRGKAANSPYCLGRRPVFPRVRSIIYD